tara:strand:+ start:28758 stop:29060 length:303 start_codon:yes stop_codon:yes gene_type:complete
MDFFEKEKPRKENAEPPPELVETLFDCINCGRLLLKTLKAKSVDSTTKVRAYCSECQEFSFAKDVSGAFFVAPAEGIKIINAETSKDNKIHTIYTEAHDV